MSGLVNMTANTLSAVVYAAFAVLVSPVAVGLFVGSFAILLLVLWPLLRLIRRLAADLVPVQARFTQRLQELLSGAKIVKSLGAEDRVHAEVRDDTSRIRWFSLRLVGLSEVAAAAELGIILSLVVLLLLHLTGLAGAVNAGVIGVILLRVSQRAQGAVSTAGQIAYGLPSMAVTMDMHAQLLEHRERSGHIAATGGFSTLRFEKVGFGYTQSREVLWDVDFGVERGEFVGIVGGSGAGKTTLVDLALGLLNPTAGRILVDGVALADMERIGWRRKLGYVPQETILFNDTVYNNISAYRNGVAEADVHWAAEIAQATEFIAQLENGYDDFVGDRGVRLSGGQRQRLALARALAARPEILLLDEATSSLDSDAERDFQEALDNVRTHFTILAVAHRLSTVMRADRVLVMYEGRIVESGPPLELIDIPDGHFRRLYTLQTAQPQHREPASAQDDSEGERT